MAIPPPPTPDRDVYEARVRAVYEEAGRAADHFLEWRHKIILLCSASLALTFAAASYIYKVHLGDVPMIIALALGAAVQAQCVRFDRRNAFLLNGASYATARECETKLRRASGDLSEVPVGVWTRIDSARGKRLPYKPPPRTYSHMLRRMYQGLATGLTAAAVAVAVFGIPAPRTSKQTRITLANGSVLCGHVVATVHARVVVALKDTGAIRSISITRLKRLQRSGC